MKMFIKHSPNIVKDVIKSRQAFIGEKKQHKFVKAIENLGLKTAGEEDAKRENANVDGDYCHGNNASIWKYSFQGIC